MSKRYFIPILIALLLVLTGCTSPQSQNVTTVSTKQPTNVPADTATPIPATRVLGPVPKNCPTSNPTRQVFPQLALVTGHTPVWASWPPGPTVFREVPSDIPSNYDPRYGWPISKVVWEVGPNYTHTITIRGYELSDHTPVLIEFDDKPMANAVLDPHHPSHPISALGDGWAEWGSYLVLSKAGCYALDVSWPTGHWTVRFAFGA